MTRTPAVASDKALGTSSVLTAEISLPEATYGSVERRSQFYAALADRLKAVPTIASVSLATALPLNGGETRSLDIDGRPRSDPKEQATLRDELGIGQARIFGIIGAELRQRIPAIGIVHIAEIIATAGPAGFTAGDRNERDGRALDLSGKSGAVELLLERAIEPRADSSVQMTQRRSRPSRIISIG